MNGGPASAKLTEFLAGFYSELQESENGSILINDMKGFDASPFLSGGPGEVYWFFHNQGVPIFGLTISCFIFISGQKFLLDQLALYDKIVRGGGGLKLVYVVNGNSS